MRLKVKLINKSYLVKVLVVLSASALLMSTVSSANAATKTITCYKGTVVKKVTAAKPKCPTGYTTTKPVAQATVKPTAAATTKSTATIFTADPTTTTTGAAGTTSSTATIFTAD